MSQTIKSAVNSENVKCKVIDYSFIREREDDDKSDVIGIMLVVINDGVIAADPFCMITKACAQSQ